IGDFVPSTLGLARGAKHFVTPKLVTAGLSDYKQYWEAWVIRRHFTGGKSPLPPRPDYLFATDVTLKASIDASFKWENATPVPGSPHLAKVSRTIPGHFPVRIRRRSTDAVVAEPHVWVVGSEIIPGDPDPRITADLPIGLSREGFLVALGFTFTHRIKPATIITPPGGTDAVVAELNVWV